MATQRPVSSERVGIRWSLPALMLVQVALGLTAPESTAVAAQLDAPSAMPALRPAAPGEPVGVAQMLTLYLQACDAQTGICMPFRDRDYPNMVSWLDRVVNLGAAKGYPLLLASRVCSQVPDSVKRRAMLDFAYRKFLEDPVSRWRCSAHAASVARHRLNDPQLALRCTRAIADYADAASVRSWQNRCTLSCWQILTNTKPPKFWPAGYWAVQRLPIQTKSLLMERLKGVGLSKFRQ